MDSMMDVFLLICHDYYVMSILRHNAEPSTAISLSTGSLFQWRGNPQVKFPGGRSRRRPTRKDNL